MYVQESWRGKKEKHQNIHLFKCFLRQVMKYCAFTCLRWVWLQSPHRKSGLRWLPSSPGPLSLPLLRLHSDPVWASLPDGTQKQERDVWNSCTRSKHSLFVSTRWWTKPLLLSGGRLASSPSWEQIGLISLINANSSTAACSVSCWYAHSKQGCTPQTTQLLYRQLPPIGLNRSFICGQGWFKQRNGSLIVPVR